MWKKVCRTKENTYFCRRKQNKAVMFNASARFFSYFYFFFTQSR